MPAQDSKRSLHARLVERILHGAGEAPADQRAAAFESADLPDALRPLVEKVVTRSDQVSDADFAAARQAGFSGDQLFELVICAAVGEATRQYTTGLRALDEATSETPR
jgi:alkylhydroperoxidase family enzyme